MEAITKRFKLWFFLYLSFIFSPCRYLQDLLLSFVRWALELYWDIHLFLNVLIYLAMQFWRTSEECLWQCWCGWVFFTQRFTVARILWQKQRGGHMSAGECVSVATYRLCSWPWPTARAETSERRQSAINIKSGKINSTLFFTTSSKTYIICSLTLHIS